MILALILASSATCIGAVRFAEPDKYPMTADRVVLARDLDRDGAPDIITSGNNVDELGALSILRNKGNGKFDDEQILPIGFGETLEDIGDLNGDGMSDLLLSDYWSNGIVTYRGAGTLVVSAGVRLVTATHGGPSRIVDYDNDGIADIVSLSFGSGNPVRVHVFRGKSDGTLAPKTSYDTNLANGATLSTRKIGSSLELLVSEHSGSLGLIRVGAEGVAVSRIAIGPGMDLSSAFADVNGDGVADIVATTDHELGASGTSPGEAIFVALGKADGTFGSPTRVSPIRHVAFPVAIRAADLDGDGNVDLIIRDFGATAVVYFRGDGRGGFAEGVAIDAGAVVNDVTVADVNGDGRPDVVTANDDHTISVVINGGACVPLRRHAARP